MINDWSCQSLAGRCHSVAIAWLRAASEPDIVFIIVKCIMHLAISRIFPFGIYSSSIVMYCTGAAFVNYWSEYRSPWLKRVENEFHLKFPTELNLNFKFKDSDSEPADCASWPLPVDSVDSHVQDVPQSGRDTVRTPCQWVRRTPGVDRLYCKFIQPLERTFELDPTVQPV